ncbi:ABC transporter substrate-binding protein [Pacificispira sp.]|uniref:ABC transporter substrate-binding protein n=1 Tax=Pacificispira sp. TaxID=2888761 RepID=UPI003B52CFCC
MMYLSRILGAAGAAAIFIAAVSAHAKDLVTVTDLAGRTVEVAVPVQRIVLGEGRFLPSLGILDREDPTARIVGMMGDFEQFDASGYAYFSRYFPGLDDIARVGKSGSYTFSLETVVSQQPDMVLLGIGSGHSPSERHTDIIEKLEAAGIPVVFIDFRIEPLANTPVSLRLLGKLMDREDEAEEFIAFYEENLAKVSARLEGVTDRPSVFLESRVGLRPDCCEAMGNKMMGRFIDWAGGINLLGEQIPGTHGTVALEYLLTHQPDHYFATAIGSPDTVDKFPERVVLGAGVAAETARDSLAHVRERKGLNELSAVQDGKAFAIWHHFYNTPMNVAAVQAMAKQLHPDRFADLSPRDTLKTYFERFQPVPLDGVYWISLNGDSDE